MKSYSVRKMGTRAGQPHYGADCNLCSPQRVLVVAHLSKEAATEIAKEHLRTMHGKD